MMIMDMLMLDRGYSFASETKEDMTRIEEFSKTVDSFKVLHLIIDSFTLEYASQASFKAGNFDACKTALTQLKVQ